MLVASKSLVPKTVSTITILPRAASSAGLAFKPST